MDQDSYSKLMASSHERHLKRTKNLPQQNGSSRRRGRSSQSGGCSGRLLLQARTNLATVLIEVFAMSLKG
jgi:hypothetical protein